MSKKNYIAPFFCFLWVFTACQSQLPTPAPASSPVAQLPTATATFTAVPPTPTPTSTNTPLPTNIPDQVASALAHHPTNTPRPTPIPTPMMYSFPPFSSNSALTNPHPAPLLPLIDHRDGSILVVGVEDNFVYFNVGVRLVKMDVNRPGVPLATAGPLPQLPQELVVLNSVVYLLFSDQTIVAYSVTDTWQPMAQFTAPHPVLRFFVHEEQLYLHLETDSGEELVWLSSALEPEQTLTLPPHTITHDLPWLYQLQITDGNITHVAQANLTEQPLTFTAPLSFPNGATYTHLIASQNFLYAIYKPDQKNHLFTYQIQNNQVVQLGQKAFPDSYWFMTLGSLTAQANGLILTEGFGDAASCSGGFSILDLTNPTQPQAVAKYGSYMIADVELQSPLAYGSGISQLVQVTDGKNSQKTVTLWQSTGYVADVAYTPGRLWVMNSACDNGSLFQYEVMPPTNLQHQQTIPAYDYLFADDQTVYYESSSVSGVTAVQIESTLETSYVQVEIPENIPMGMVQLIQGHYAIVDFIDYKDDVRFFSLIYDTTAPENWQLVSEIPRYGSLIWEGNTLYGAVPIPGEEGIYLTDVTDITSPTLINSFPSPAEPQTAGNGFLYAIPRLQYYLSEPEATQNKQQATQLYIYNVQDPATPFLLTTFTLPEPTHTFRLDGTTAYALGDDLWVYDVSNPAVPQLIAYYPTPGRASDLVITDTAVYLADGDAGILMFEKPTQE